MRHPIIPQPIDHNTVRVKVELGAAVPEGMTGTLHLAWYDPNDTLANVSSNPPTYMGHGARDNAASLSAAGGNLPGFTLEFATDGPTETSDSVQKAYLAIDDARYGDNFIVVAHPNEGIAETFEFRANDSQQLVLMRPANTGLWHALPDESGNDYRTMLLTILPSVDVDTDSDNNGPLERSDWEEEIENDFGYIGKKVAYNYDDDNGNGIEDYLENAEYEYPGELSWTPFVDDDLVQVILDRGFEDLSGMDGFVFELKVTTGANRGLGYWLDREKTCIETSSYAPDDIDYITENGNDKTVYRWFVSGGDVYCPPEIYVEGVNPDALTDTLMWRLWKPVDSLYVEADVDAVKMTDPTVFDLAMDTDYDGDIDRTWREDHFECHSQPGGDSKYGLGALIEPGADKRQKVCVTIPIEALGAAATIEFRRENFAEEHGGRISLWKSQDPMSQSIIFGVPIDIASLGNPANGFSWQPVTDGNRTVAQQLVVWVQGDTETLIDHWVDGIENNTKPTTAIKAIFKDKNAIEFSDTVNYIVAADNTFWYELVHSPDLQCALASDGVYRNADLPAFALRPIASTSELRSLGVRTMYRSGTNFNTIGGAESFDVVAALDGSLARSPESHGFNAVLYFDYVHFRYVMAFQGSDKIGPNTTDDWIDTNLVQAFGGKTFQYTMAQAIACSFIVATDKGKMGALATGGLFYTGHSLGGGLATAASLASASLVDTELNPVAIGGIQQRAVVFNPAGVHPKTVRTQPSGREDWRIRAYIVQGEFINDLQDSWPSAVLRKVAMGAIPRTRTTARVSLDIDDPGASPIARHVRYLRGMIRLVRNMPDQYPGDMYFTS